MNGAWRPSPGPHEARQGGPQTRAPQEQLAGAEVNCAADGPVRPGRNRQVVLYRHRDRGPQRSAQGMKKGRNWSYGHNN